MIIKKGVLPLSYKTLYKYKTKLFWCSDGWVYDTAKLKRRKYTEKNIVEESFIKTVFSDVQYIEDVEINVISDRPKQWVEYNEFFEECV
jgi:hypothetical protein